MDVFAPDVELGMVVPGPNVDGAWTRPRPLWDWVGTR